MGFLVTKDDNEPIAEDAEFVVLADQTLVGWIKVGSKTQLARVQARIHARYEHNIANFENRTNVAEKLSVIAQQFGIDSDLRAHMPGLSKARNALTHNWGVVGVRHCTHDRELRLSWLGLEMSVGDKVIPVDFEQFRVEQGERLVVRTLVRERTIPINMLIDLSPYDLSEICLTYWSQAQKIIAEVGRQIRELGIKPAEVGRSERPQEPDQNP